MTEELFAYLDRIKEMNPKYVSDLYDDNTTNWYNLKEKNIGTVDAKVIATLTNIGKADSITPETFKNDQPEWLQQLLRLSSPLGEVKCMSYYDGINTWGGGYRDLRVFIFVDGYYILEVTGFAYIN